MCITPLIDFPFLSGGGFGGGYNNIMGDLMVAWWRECSVRDLVMVRALGHNWMEEIVLSIEEEVTTMKMKE